MKAFLALFLFVAVASAAELYEVRLLGNHLEDLVTETLEYVRFLLKKHDPYVLPNMPDQHLQDTDIDFVLSASDMGLSNAAGFTIDNIKVNPLTLKASFQVTIPSGHVAGNYKISGTGWGKKVEGSGALTGDLTNFVQSGNLQLGVVDHSIQVKDLSLDYSIGDLKIAVDGLEIEGMTKDEVNDLLNKQLLNNLKNNKAFVVEHAAAQVKTIANKILHGHTLAEVIAYVEKLVASTPDPPPFTFSP
ncbi:uncharacterized protein [Halyomorpha halys]|uniref:uncharacterized protein n=1 Tax=Halyomorpha halys TaxID=286706 RepID=UPI0006D4F205|nr:uncharacterized protein LOC106689937 [Halyomorpha halys]